MSEKGQGETLPVGTGTVLAEPSGGGGASAVAPQKYEGRQPTEAEREAGRWLDEPADAGTQPKGSGDGGASATGPAEDRTEWIDENTFIGPGGTPFEFQPTEGKPTTPTQPAPDPYGSSGERSDRPEPRYGRPSEGPTRIEPPSLDLENVTPQEEDKSSLEYMDTEGETTSTDDDQRPVLS
jgi:hypothetical protein